MKNFLWLRRSDPHHVGPVERLRRWAERLGHQWLRGWKPSAALYATPQVV